jgi:hypothetical protein
MPRACGVCDAITAEFKWIDPGVALSQTIRVRTHVRVDDPGEDN